MLKTVKRPTRSAAGKVRRTSARLVHILGKQVPILEAVNSLVVNGVATPQQAAIISHHLNTMRRELQEAHDPDQTLRWQQLDIDFIDRDRVPFAPATYIVSDN